MSSGNQRVHNFVTYMTSMAESKQVKLHGFWASPYVHRVIWALKLKGVKYEYIEEDLPNKSPSLLEYNPIYKKVPVLVHGGKPVVESALILEYIEETWPHHTPLLPKDPYERAMARFWIDFGEKSGVTFMAFFLSSEEDKEKTARQMGETLRIIQDEALGDKRFFGGDSLSLMDLYFGWLANSLEAIEKVAGVCVLEPTTLPRLHRWTLDFKQEPVVKECRPDIALLFKQYERAKKGLTSPEKN